METITLGFIILLNAMSIYMLFKILNDKDIKNRILITTISAIIMYILLYIIYGISSSNIPEIVMKKSRTLILFTFLPINILCTIIPIMMQLKKLNQKQIDSKKCNKRLIIIVIISLIILFIEGNYFNDIQGTILKLQYDKITSQNQ